MSTLGGNGDSEPLPESWANRSSQPRVGRIGGPSTAAPQPSGPGRLATLRDFAQPSGGHGGHGHGGGGGGGRGRPRDDDDDSEDEDVPQNFFAGGERSGLSVENPNHPSRRGAENQVREILRRAAEGSRAAMDRERTRGPFVGTGHTLGSDETPGESIPDADAEEEEDQEVAVRNITFWRTGFTVMDGPLRSYNDPESAQLLELIQQGLAPPEVLNVRRGQPVELNIAKRLNEDYVPPPPGPFAGSGNRLGSPVPDITTSAPSTSTRPATQGSNTAGGSTEPVKFEVDMTAPTTSIQIRLADGTRIVCRMNLTHTVGDIRRHINASRPGTSSRPYSIQTTLPVKVLDDESQTIDGANLKNSVVVQRWL